jgi:hypothetical protein
LPLWQKLTLRKDHGAYEKLSGSDYLAKGNGVGEKGLFDQQWIAEVRGLWTVEPDKARSGLGASNIAEGHGRLIDSQLRHLFMRCRLRLNWLAILDASTRAGE